ncbi:MAG TPA: NAD(P)H-dependent oxidoreductase [Anaerolineae bacterium]|jgi:putative NADPH-quinone reductase|nr:NAD(P)H-dependent oxidoreductase [Anaerolineae bacterium]
MKVLVILAHPGTRSFNHAIADTAVQALKENGHEAMFHDLYQEQFDPVLPYEEVPRGAELDPVTKQHVEELKSADGIIIIHPSWWGQPPAILKGWIDRTFRPGIAYEFKEGTKGFTAPTGLLKAENALVINTTNTPVEVILQVFGDTLGDIWDKSVLSFCGVKHFNRKVYDQMVISTPEQRKVWLDDVQTTIRQLFPKPGEMRIPA